MMLNILKTLFENKYNRLKMIILLLSINIHQTTYFNSQGD